MVSLRNRMAGLSTATTDGLVVAVVAFPTFMDAWWNQPGTRQADWITYLLAAIAVGSLLRRRSWPYAVTLIGASVLTAWNAMGHFGELLNLPTMVGLYTIAVQGNRQRSITVGVIASTWSGLLAEVVGTPVGSPTLEMLWPLVPLALGEAVRQRHELLAQHAAQAARAERLNIAREFHDVVAHTMAAVNVQMEVAVAAFDQRPDTARQALRQARSSSKEALAELRSSIAMLRDTTTSEPDQRSPVPRLTQLDTLAQTARSAGIAVTIDDKTRGELPTAVELAIYRIVQEALTNIIRHANATTAAVSIQHPDDDLVVEIRDDGSGARSDGRSHAGGTDGHGLAGMTERATALGGHLEHGPCPDGGFQVRAVLPARAGPP